MPIPESVQSELNQLRQEMIEEDPAGEIFRDLEFDKVEDIAMLLFAAAAARGSVSLYFTRDDGELEAVTAHARTGEQGELLTVISIDSPDDVHSPEILDFAVELGNQQLQIEADKLLDE